MILFAACALTVLIETPFLMLFGYRDRDAVTVIVCANVISNLLLNLVRAFFLPQSAAVYPLEAAVVVGEYLIYRAAFGGSRRLFALTLAANCLSYALGLLIF